MMIGVLLGMLTTAISIPLVMIILKFWDHQEIPAIWFRFKLLGSETSRIIALSSITNLFWFHRFSRSTKYHISMGIILATAINLIVSLLIKYV